MEQTPITIEKQEATYYIGAHGIILTTNYADIDSGIVTKKYHAIDIPQNIELYTYADMGKCLRSSGTELNVTCNHNSSKNKYKVLNVISATYKFIHEDGKKNKFPNLFFTPDHNEKAQFYSGLIHCIPNKNSLRAKEVIYSIDARNTKNCECSSIVPMVKSDPYDCGKNYSDYYKAQLCDKDYSKTQLEEPKIAEPKIAEPKIAEPKIAINKCGPILLSEALVLIQRHNIKYYGPNCAIKIYISSCLGEGDLVNARKHYRSAFLTRWNKKKEHEPTLSIKEKSLVIYNDGYEGEKQREPLLIDGNYFTAEDEVASLAESLAESLANALTKKKEISLEQNNIDYDYYNDCIKHNTSSKIDYQNVVSSLDEFKGIILTTSTFSYYTYTYNNKIFKIKTFKDAYTKFYESDSSKIDELQKKHRTLSQNNLEKHLNDALDKFADDDDLYSDKNETDFLPRIVEINLAMPFNITKTSDGTPFDLTDIIYKQLEELIKLEKEKRLGQGVKTLRKKYKKPKKHSTNKLKHNNKIAKLKHTKKRRKNKHANK
jgi:hypothetical protein